MKLGSFYLKGVRGLPAIDLEFLDSATNRVRSRTVIAGSNGTGKTTILDTIHALSALVLKDQQERPPAWLVREDALAWMCLKELPTRSAQDLVLYVADKRAALRQIGSQASEPQHVATYGWTRESQTKHGYDSPPAVISELRGQLDDIRWGDTLDEGLPAVLYFPSDQRELQPKPKGQIIAEENGYQWSYRFSDSQRWEGSLESFLVAMDYQELLQQREGRRDDGKFHTFLSVINKFLDGKQIVGVDSDTFRIQVRADDGGTFRIDALSAGEKQILLLLGEIQRRIRAGSIILIDEPEMHLHPKWQRLLVRALTDLCAEHDAQLIMTTHSREIAHAVYEHELILLDEIFAQVPA